ncbi:MAG: NAD(P)H-dependent oxidoreductase [Myxococcota bacterium]
MHVLRIDSSARRSDSASRQLADAIVESLRASSGDDWQLTTRDLTTQPPLLLDETLVTAFFTDAGARTPEQRERLAVSTDPIEELRAADALVLSVPIYNFGIPAALKAWIDLVVRARETFRYTANGPEGLLSGIPAYLAVASGGTPVGSPVDFATPYLRHVLAFIGVGEIQIYAADGLVAGGEARLAEALTDARAALAPGASR